MRKLLRVAVACAFALATVALASTGANAAADNGVNARGMSPNLSVAPMIIFSNEQAAFNFFVGKGLTKKQAAGIVGNLDQESGMDPTIKQYGGGPGRGIAQWSVGGRWDTYVGDNEVHFTTVHLGVSRWNLKGQFKFTWHELHSFSYYGLATLKNQTTIDGAVRVFQNQFEGCGTCNTSARIHYAHAAFNRYA